LTKNEQVHDLNEKTQHSLQRNNGKHYSSTERKPKAIKSDEGEENNEIHRTSTFKHKKVERRN